MKITHFIKQLGRICTISSSNASDVTLVVSLQNQSRSMNSKATFSAFSFVLLILHHLQQFTLLSWELSSGREIMLPGLLVPLVMFRLFEQLCS
jgi:hypothetical protein